MRSTSRGGTARPRVFASFDDFGHPHLLRLVLRTQPRSGGGAPRDAALTFFRYAKSGRIDSNRQMREILAGRRIDPTAGETNSGQRQFSFRFLAAANPSTRTALRKCK